MPVTPEIAAMNLLKQIALIWIQYRTFRTLFAELSSWSDHALNDLGLHRGDLARVAFEMAEQRTAALVPRRSETRDGKHRETLALGASR